MSSTKILKVAKEIGKPSGRMERNSEISAKELRANPDTPVTVTSGGGRRKRRNRHRQERRRESRHVIREQLAEGGGVRRQKKLKKC